MPMIGKCPDMCPEKERLERTIKVELAPFERFDERLVMIKQYGWDADKRQLPQELRPEPVLQLTMDYMLKNFVNCCQEFGTDIFVWFYFISDRLRSIRQDIIQQKLCSPTIALIFEQCVRFHAHCICRLIGEEDEILLQQRNMEDLNESLYILTHIYDSLNKKTICCPNEAEFRAYTVLLNLNDNGILSQVLQMDRNVQQSKQIQFALSVQMSVASDNTDKFFLLISKATYTCACTLLGYFTQMRLKAVSYILSNSHLFTTQVKISKLTEMLAFDNNDQCMLFMKHYGLKCAQDAVTMDIADFNSSRVPFTLNSTPIVIQNRLQTTVYEAIIGMNAPGGNCAPPSDQQISFNESG